MAFLLLFFGSFVLGSISCCVVMLVFRAFSVVFPCIGVFGILVSWVDILSILVADFVEVTQCMCFLYFGHISLALLLSINFIILSHYSFASS